MNLNFFGDSTGENIEFAGSVSPDSADAVRQAENQKNERSKPTILRALLAAPPIHSLTQPEALPGNIFHLSHGDIGRHRLEWMQRNASFREGYITLEIPQPIIEVLQIPTMVTSGIIELEHVLRDICEIPPADFVTGTIVDENSNNKRTGLSVLIKEDNYRALAREALELLTNPRTGCQLCGSANEETYRYALKDPESEPSKIVIRMYEAAGFLRKEAEEIKNSAISHNNFEFAALINGLLTATDKKLGRSDNRMQPPQV